MGILKTILVILLIYYLFKILARWFAPKFFAYAARKTERHFKEQFENFQAPSQDDERPEGDISIDKKPTRNRSNSKDIGEYIDFEELE